MREALTLPLCIPVEVFSSAGLAPLLALRGDALGALPDGYLDACDAYIESARLEALDAIQQHAAFIDDESEGAASPLPVCTCLEERGLDAEAFRIERLEREHAEALGRLASIRRLADELSDLHEASERLAHAYAQKERNHEGH